MQRVPFFKSMYVVVIFVMALCFASGCSIFESNTMDTPEDDALADSENAPQYLDFGDILVPKELKILKKNSFVFRAGGLSAGVLSMKGGVEVDSLISFFENNMAKDNWRLVSYFKSLRTLMLFQKDLRWCVINISDRDFSTLVEIWVAPTVGDLPPDVLKTQDLLK